MGSLPDVNLTPSGRELLSQLVRDDWYVFLVSFSGPPLKRCYQKEELAKATDLANTRNVHSPISPAASAPTPSLARPRHGLTKKLKLGLSWRTQPRVSGDQESEEVEDGREEVRLQ